LRNNRLEYSWHVARIDYWRWHFIMNCHFDKSIDQVTSIWEDDDGKIVAVLNPVSMGEIRVHILPTINSSVMVNEILVRAEEYFTGETQPGTCILGTDILNLS
jgi:hypothetical protein